MASIRPTKNDIEDAIMKVRLNLYDRIRDGERAYMSPTECFGAMELANRQLAALIEDETPIVPLRDNLLNASAIVLWALASTIMVERKHGKDHQRQQNPVPVGTTGRG